MYEMTKAGIILCVFYVVNGVWQFVTSLTATGTHMP